MRRIAPAIGPVLALLAVSVPATPAHAAVPHATQTRAALTSSLATTTFKAALPSKITTAFGRRGPRPGSTTIRWKSEGGHTDFYRITTALTPFGTPGHPGPGRHSMTWRAPGDVTHYTLSPAKTAKAGAALGTARHLFFRIK